MLAQIVAERAADHASVQLSGPGDHLAIWTNKPRCTLIYLVLRPASRRLAEQYRSQSFMNARRFSKDRLAHRQLQPCFRSCGPKSSQRFRSDAKFPPAQSWNVERNPWGTACTSIRPVTAVSAMSDATSRRRKDKIYKYSLAHAVQQCDGAWTQRYAILPPGLLYVQQAPSRSCSTDRSHPGSLL